MEICNKKFLINSKCFSPQNCGQGFMDENIIDFYSNNWKVFVKYSVSFKDILTYLEPAYTINLERILNVSRLIKADKAITVAKVNN